MKACVASSVHGRTDERASTVEAHGDRQGRRYRSGASRWRSGRVTVRHRAGAADEALGEAARKTQALEDLFVDLGIDRERWVTAGLGLEEWTDWDEASRQQVRHGYIATSRVVVTLPDTDSLGNLLAEAVARTEAAVEGRGGTSLLSRRVASPGDG
jgi:hypothetical protein